MALPKEPRQKMINMMYLVLTAMLAINVSAEILNAFKTVDHSINNSSNLIMHKTADQMAAFTNAIKDQGLDKVAPFQKHAQEASQAADAAVSYIEALKLNVKMNSHGKAPDGEHFSDDNMDGPTRVMDNQGKGKILRDSLIAWRKAFLTMVPEDQKALVDASLALKIDTPHVENKGNTDWVGAHFRMVPAIAAITILDKFENDIRASANTVIEDNLSQINAKDVHLDHFIPIISENSGYLMNGQQFSAKISVGAYSSAIHPIITVDGNPVTAVDGLASYSETASGAGTHTHKVIVRLPKPGGGYEDLPQADLTYNVGSATFAVSSDLTKVMFRGIDNPISVSGGGVGAEALGVQASNGNINKTGAGKYSIKPGDANECKISVSAHRPDGTTANLGTETFLVKDLPNPVAYVGQNGGGRMRAAEFRINSGVRAVLEGFDFLSGVRFEITSFTVYAVGGDFNGLQQASSNSFSFATIQNIISKCKPGTNIIFDDIHARGPDGRNRKIKPISFSLY